MIKILKTIVSYFIRLKKRVRPFLETINIFFYYLVRRKQVSIYIKNNQTRKLQIGTGTNVMEGWLNSDLYPRKGMIYLNATKPLPFPNQSFDYIYSEHMIEHISFQDGYKFLEDSFRILRAGGKIRIATPNLSFYLKLFSTNKTPEQKEYMEWMYSNWIKKSGASFQNEAFILNLVQHAWGHVFIYDFVTLKSVLEKIGFDSIKQFECQISEDINLKDLEKHGEHTGNVAMNHLETLVVEAKKG